LEFTAEVEMIKL